MKINRFIALAAIALLAIGALSAFASRSSALGTHSPAAQSDACAQDEADGAEVASVEDTDNVELQCGDQNEADGQETVDGADTDNDQVEEQVGDQGGPDTGVEALEVEAPAVP